MYMRRERYKTLTVTLLLQPSSSGSWWWASKPKQARPDGGNQKNVRLPVTAKPLSHEEEEQNGCRDWSRKWASFNIQSGPSAGNMFFAYIGDVCGCLGLCFERNQHRIITAAAILEHS
jgi:hypothetical protein